MEGCREGERTRQGGWRETGRGGGRQGGVEGDREVWREQGEVT